MMLYICVVSSKYLEQFSTYRADMSYMNRVEMANFNIYYVQRAQLQK